MNYRVNIKETAVVNLVAIKQALQSQERPPADAIQALDVCLRHRVSMMPKVAMLPPSLSSLSPSLLPFLPLGSI